MTNELTNILNKIGTEYKTRIKHNSEQYCQVDLGVAANFFGYKELEAQYHNIKVVVPLNKSGDGLVLLTQGSKFEGYIQLNNGIVVEESIAQKANMSGTKYVPHKQMILTNPERK